VASVETVASNLERRPLVLVGQCGPPQPLFKGLVDIPISQVVSKSRPDDQIDSQHRVAYDTVGMWHQSIVTRVFFFFFFFFLS
jgi:hypothetical protein